MRLRNGQVCRKSHRLRKTQSQQQGRSNWQALPAVAAAAPPPRPAEAALDIGTLPAASTAAYAKENDISRLDELYDRSASWAVGQGGMGAVSSVVKKATGEVYALKTMPTDPWVDDAELARICEARCARECAGGFIQKAP